MRSDQSDAPSPELPSAASNSSTISSGHRDRLSSSPAAHHLHFATDVFPSPSLSARGLHPGGSQSAGRRTPQPHLPPQRRTSRTISADPLLSPRERRASLATSAAYTTAPSSITARRTSMGRLRSGRPIKKEDAEVWEFGENTPNPGLTASTSSRKGMNASEDEQLHQRLARIDMDLVMRALQDQSTPPPRHEFGLSASTSSGPLSTPPTLTGTHRSSSFATTSSPLRVEDLRLPRVGSPDSKGDSTKEKRKRPRIISLTRRGKEKLTPAEGEERTRLEEMQRIERIRHIHSTLTHSIQSRADSAKQQFEARYNYLLSAPPQHGRRPPTFLDVVKWKRTMRDIDRLKRRHESRVALSRGQSLSRMTTNDSAGDPALKSVASSPEGGSRRESFNISNRSGNPASFSTDTVSHWAEQLILAKHRRKRSVLTGSTTALAWDSVGMIGKSSDWDFTAQDIMDYLACRGAVEEFTPPEEQEREVRSSEERETMELSRILRRTVGLPGQERSAPPSLLSATSADDSIVERLASPVQRGRGAVHVNVVPPTIGKRQLSLVTEDEPESPSDARKKRRGRLVSAPESPISGRDEASPGDKSSRFNRTHSMGMGRGGSISQAFGNFLNLSGSVAGSQEAFGATPSGVASSRQSVSGKKWTPGRLRQSLDDTRDKSPDGSASERPFSAVNSDNDVASGPDVPWKRSGKNKRKRKIPALTFSRRNTEADKGPDESVLSLPTPGPTQPPPKLVLPNVPGFEKEEEEPEESVDSEEEAAEYERKSRMLETVQLQVSRMDNILASSRIKHLAQELLDMRAQTLTMPTGAPVILPPLPEELPLPTPRPRLQELHVSRKSHTDVVRPADHHVVSALRGALPRTVSEPLPDEDEEEDAIMDHPRARAMPISRSASLPQKDDADIDLVPHIQESLDRLASQWKEVDVRLDSLFALQQSAFQTHARMQVAAEAAQAQFFAELQVMDRLDDRIHRLKTRNIGNSWLFTFLAGLAEVLLFFVWLIAKCIQVVFFRIPKLGYKAIIKLFVFLWWLIRWVLFLDYLWP